MSRLLAFAFFIIFYATEVVKSNLRVAYDAMTPQHHMKPGILAVDVSGMTDRQLLFMANFITMTPGTLGLIISGAKDKLYIHAMYVDKDMETMARELQQDYGRRVQRVF